MTLSFLSLVFLVKIAVTVVAVAGPFLLFGRQRLEALTGVTGKSVTLFRLYGMAIVALLIGYGSAFPVLDAGRFPWGIVVMGMVSNGGAAWVLWRDQDTIAHRRLLLALFGGIFIALSASVTAPHLATVPLLP